MKPIIISLIFVFFTATFLFSQSTSFQNTLGMSLSDRGNCITRTLDGNYLVGGSIDIDGFGITDFYLVKINQNGDTIWTKAYENSALSSSIEHIYADKDSGFICAGTSLVSFGDRDIVVFKVDKSGNFIWGKSFGGSADDNAFHVTGTSDNGYLVTGSTRSFGLSDKNIYLIKTGASGDTLWTRVLSTDSSDAGFSALEKNDKGFLVAANTWGFGEGEGDIALISTDSSGSISWVKTFGGRWDEVPFALEQTKDGGYIICGNTESWLGGITTPTDSHPLFNKQDIYAVRLKPDYDTLWTKTYGGGNTALDEAYSVKETADGNFVICGSTSSFGIFKSGYYLKISNTGDTVWTRMIDGGDIDVLNFVEIAPDDKPVLIGTSKSFSAGGDEDVLIAKADVSGNIPCNGFGTPTIPGRTETKINTVNQFQVSAGATVTNLSFLDKNPQALFSRQCYCEVSVTISATKDTICKGDTLIISATGTGSGFLWNTGETTSSISVAPDSTTPYSVVATNDTCSAQATFIVNVKNCTGIKELNIGQNKFSLYPTLVRNSNAILTIQYEQSSKETAQFELMNLLGAKIKTIELSNGKTEMQIAHLPNGIYLYCVKSGNTNIHSGKIVISR